MSFVLPDGNGLGELPACHLCCNNLNVYIPSTVGINVAISKLNATFPF